ncbi:uncharacterized protein [Eurosta solidaginis]|uniref:uncharacterized protein n=1 Tax=Eurosta solidaginis TaxID=178769 RepID=UPI0035305B53
MSADSSRCQSHGMAAPAVVPPQVVSDRSILDSAIGFISDVTLVAHQPHTEPKDTIIWARFETTADISDPCFGIDWELEGNVAPPLLLILGYGLGVQVWAIPANGEAIEVLSWRHGVVSTLRILPTPACTRSANEHGRADETIDAYAEKRPLIALVDTSTTSSQPQFCTLNFISLKTGKQVKTIKFKNPILDVISNRTSVVSVFHERIAIFDARTLEDRLSITTCYPSPGINPNPVALGQRWLAYAEQKLLSSKRSGGGWDGEGIASYTATVLNAAKSFGKGLRELGEQVAAGLTGASNTGSLSKNSSFDSSIGPEAKQPGIVTIMDVEQTIKDYSPTSTIASAGGNISNEPIVAHFIAHSDAIVAMEFDNSGMLLLTADRRGHDFHVFRIQPHPVSSSLSAIHHLYVLHRGDTSAKVQNITFSLDSRWVAISTLRGTTHVFPITPYGGPMGVRTHTSLHVVNKLSRFHRSAGLSADGRSNSPITHSESSSFMQSLQPYHITTLPPFPRPNVVLPLAQLRQPFALGSPPVSAGLVMPGKMGVNSGGGGSGAGSSGTSNTSQRQRHSSLSDDNGKPLSVCAIFAKSRSWLLEPPNVTREASHRIQRKAIDSLFVMAGHGALIQYDLDTKLASNIAKEKICDDTPIELDVEAKAQWNLGRRRDGSHELMPPLANDNWLIKDRNSCLLLDSMRQYDIEEKTESWVSQVEIITHAGPHRRLWMGPQCVFKTYNTPSGSNLNHVDVEAVEIGVSKPTSAASAVRSHSLSMPVAAARCNLPVLIESGSYSSIEQSPKLMDRFRHEHSDSDFTLSHGDSRLKEDLADAMRESPSVSEIHKSTCRLAYEVASSDNVSFYDARADPDFGDDDYDPNSKASASYTSETTENSPALAGWNLVCNVYSDKNRTVHLHPNVFGRKSETQKPSKASVEKVVNPLGTVTTVISGISSEVRRDILDEVVLQLASEDDIIHENCDESLFRPVVAIFCDDKDRQAAEIAVAHENEEFLKPPEVIKNNLVVPVIAKEVDAELSKREKSQKSEKVKMQTMRSFINQQKLDEQKSIQDSKLKCKPASLNINKAEQTTEKFMNDVKLIETPISGDNLTTNNTLKNQQKKKDKCEDIKEPRMLGDKTKFGDGNKSNIKQTVIYEEEKEEEPTEFKRMTPIAPLAKNGKQTHNAAVKSPSKEQSTVNECKTKTNVIKANEVKKLAKVGAKNIILKKKEYIDDDDDEQENNPSKDKLEKINFKTEQTCKSNVEDQNLILPKSKEPNSNKHGSETKLNTVSKTKKEANEPVKTHTRKSEDLEIEQKVENVLDNSTSSRNNMRNKVLKELEIETESETQSKGEARKDMDKLSKDIKRKFKPNEVAPTADTKSLTAPDEKHNNVSSTYKIKVIESIEPNKQDELVKVKVGPQDLNDIPNKDNKRGDSKSIDLKKGEDQEPGCDTKQTSDTQAACNFKGDIIDDENVKAIGKSKNPKSKTYTEKALAIDPGNSSSTIISADIVAKSRKKSKPDTNIIALNEEKVISPLLETKQSETFQNLQAPKTMNSAWKAVSNLENTERNVEANANYPSLGVVCKPKKPIKNKDNFTEKSEDIVSDVSSTMKLTQTIDKKLNLINENKSERPWSSHFEGFPALQPIEALPPLPALESLDIDMAPFSTISKKNYVKLITKNEKDDATDQSLINFDSPFQDNPKYDNKELNQKNLIFALCGSLHYENDNEIGDNDNKPDTQHVINSDKDESSTAQYKLLNENEEPNLDFEPSPHATSTTKPTTMTRITKEKYSSSANSSASEEIIIIEEKKMSKKQRKKRQQLESRDKKEESETRDDDEELRPLIAMIDSHTEIPTICDNNESSITLPTSTNNISKDIIQKHPILIARASPLGNSTTTTTTTDSEGPIPATTSDDNNIFILPSNTAVAINAPIKLKTKRLEHKINLIAAIDAATSSSTSSAEESNVEAENRRSNSDQDLPVLGISTPQQVQSTLTNVSLVTPSCATKKKTKRRKR